MKPTILRLLRDIKQLQRKPGNGALLRSLQEELIREIRNRERRIRTLRRRITEEKRRLAAVDGVRLSKETARAVKRRLSRLGDAVGDHQFLLYLFRVLGDCIAFIHIDKWDIKPWTRKEHAGFITGKRGLRLELKILRLFLAKRVTAILTDITNCLRHGDIVAIHKGRAHLIEAKSGRGRNERTARQVRNAEEVGEYLRTGKGRDPSRPEWKVRRQSLTARERSRRRAFSRLVGRARREGFAASSPERGLCYAASKGVPPEAKVKRLIARFPKPPLVFIINPKETLAPYYYPLALSVEDPEDVFSLYTGEVSALVLIDREYVVERAKELGASVRFLTDDEWMLEVTVVVDDGEPLVMTVARQYFARVALELMSLEWFLQEIVTGAARPPVDDPVQDAEAANPPVG